QNPHRRDSYPDEHRPSSEQRPAMKPAFKAACAYVVILFVFATSAPCQIPKRFAIFAGYSTEADITFASASVLPISLPSVSLEGWNASFEAKVLPFLGVVADASGHYGTFGAT